MNYNYSAKGGISVFGSSLFKVEFFYSPEFPTGSIAYNRDAAYKGKLEAVVIKKYKVLFDGEDFLYTDTVNALWNEWQLCSLPEGLELIAAYKNRIGIEAESLLGAIQ